MDSQLLAGLLTGHISPDNIDENGLSREESLLVAQIKQGATLIDIKPTTDYITFVKIMQDVETLLNMGEEARSLTLTKVLENHRIKTTSAALLRSLQKSIRYLELGDLNSAYAEASTLPSVSPSLVLEDTYSHLSNAMTETSGYMTGIKAIDNKGGWLLGNMVSIIGDSGSMKTMLSLYLCIQILKENPTFTCMYFEKEMPVKDIARRLIAYITMEPLNHIITAASSNDQSKISRISDMISLAYQDDNTKSILDRLYVVGPDKFSTAVDISILVKQYKPSIWCLDFLTMLEADGSDSYTFYKQQMDILKNTTVATDSTSIILGQIKQNALQDKTAKIPLIADAEFSSKLKQYSAYIYTTFFPRMYYTETYVPAAYYYLVGLKNRHDVPSTIPLIASPHIASFREATGQTYEQMMKWYNGYIAKKN